MAKSQGNYVDGFVMIVYKDQLEAYKRLSKKAGKVWRKYGALDYKECMGDDLGTKWGTPFPKLAKAKPNELVFFSFIVYKSRRHRDAVNKKVMADPMMTDPKHKDKPMPFDMKRMSFGGFKVVVNC